jgi:protein tyrosine/serine phosphatase
VIPNFDIVEAGIYRGGQPDCGEHWQFLKDLGVEQVIKLNTDSEGSDEAWTKMGGELFKVPETAWKQIITEPDIAVQILTAVEFIRPKTFIHCLHGQDRTGLVIGAYRLKRGWSKREAYVEMLSHGFHPILLGLSKAWADL